MNVTVWTYIGTIVSFLIFVAILYKLLYKPVGRVLKERKDAMEADLREAEKLRAEAEQLRAEARKHEQELDAKRDGILKEARDQAAAERKQLLEETEKEARARIERFRRILKQERDDLLAQVRDDLRETLMAVAAAVIAKDADLLADRSIERMESLAAEMSEDDVSAARAALDGENRAVEVRSAGALGDAQQERLKKALASKLGIEAVRIEVAEDNSLIAGVEMSLGHIRLAAHWRGMIEEALSKDSAEAEQS